MTTSATLEAAEAAEEAIAVALEDLAWGYASRVKASPVHWISGGDDACSDYCEDCVDEAAEAAGGEADGGWDHRRTSDTTTYCETCGCPLGYALSEYGLKQEVDHFETKGPALHYPPSPLQAYEVHAVADAAVSALRHGDAEAKAFAKRAIKVVCAELGVTREMARQLAG